MWNAIALVTGGFTLAAFFAATAYWAYRRSLLSKETLVDSVPEAERGRILQDYLEAVHVDTTDLTKEQRFILARELITARTKSSRERALVLLLFGVIAGGVTLFAIAKDKSGNTAPATTTTAPAIGAAPAATQAQILPSEVSHETGTSGIAKRSVLLRGLVQDADTSAPISAAAVTVRSRSPETLETRTDSDGKFMLRLPALLAEVPLEYAVRADGYSPTTQTVNVQGLAADVNIALRSVASVRFRSLRGRWESIQDDEDLSMKAHLVVADGDTSNERRGTLEITMTAKNNDGFFGGPVLQPAEPSMCRIAMSVVVSYTRDALWLHMGDSRLIAQTGQMINCGAGSAAGGAAKLKWTSDDTLVFEAEDIDEPDMTFRRVGS